MGEIIARNMLSWLELLINTNKLLLSSEVEQRTVESYLHFLYTLILRWAVKRKEIL